MRAAYRLLILTLLCLHVPAGAWDGPATSWTTNALSVYCAACETTPLFSPTDKIEAAILVELYSAKHSIHCSLFGISNGNLAAALISQAHVGRQVQVSLDKRQAALPSDLHTLLQTTGVDVSIKRTNALEHNKFCVIDGQTVTMGSWNWSQAAQSQDNSEVIFRQCPDVAAKFEAAFQRIWRRDR